MHILNGITHVWTPVNGLLLRIAPLADLVVRLWVAQIFWKAGLSKIKNWESTLWLFENEYRVPLLSAQVAAVLGTAVELVLPVLLALGLAGRFAALTLFAFNIVAVLSYPGLSEVGLKDHPHWGLLLLLLMTHGPGTLSLDRYLWRRRAPAF